MPKVSKEHTEQRRREILAAARAVFLRKGYEPTTMKDIVAESGKSFGGVYMYYATKEELFTELLTETYRAMGAAYERRPDCSAWQAIEAFLLDQQRRVEEATEGLAPVLYEYFTTGWRDETRRAFMRQRYEAVHGRILALLEGGVQAGEFRPRVPVEALAHLLVSTLDGLFFETITAGGATIHLSGQFDTLRVMLSTLLGRNDS